MSSQNIVLPVQPDRNGGSHMTTPDVSEHRASSRGAVEDNDSVVVVTTDAPVRDVIPLPTTTLDHEGQAFKIGRSTYHAPELMMTEQEVEDLIAKRQNDRNSIEQSRVANARVFYREASGLRTETIRMLVAMAANWKKEDLERREHLKDLAIEYDLNLSDHKSLLETMTDKASEFRKLTAKVGIHCEPTSDALQTALFKAA